MTVISAYFSGKTLQHWTSSESMAVLGQLRSYGINTIFSEADTYHDAIIDRVHSMGMQFMAGLTCFHNADALSTHPELHPILRDGQPRPQMNWYIGLTPTVEPYAQQRLDALQSMLTHHPVDGVWLDFVRWALHWEQELRDDTPPPLESSFDPHTLKRFARYAGIVIPSGTVIEQSDWILTHHREAWIDFKCSIITDFVSRARTILNTHAPDKPLGLDIVPASQSDREHLLGQRLPDLAQYADYLSPMLYHHILGKSPAWITDTLDEMAGNCNAPLLPFVQVDALGGAPDFIPIHEWEAVINHIRIHPATVGLIAFTGDQLDPRHGHALRAVLERQS